MKFTCKCCGKTIDGIPTFGSSKPLHYYSVPEEKRSGIFLTEDLCVIESKWFYVRGCIEIPVHGCDDPFIWGVWVSLSEPNFHEFKDLLGLRERSHRGPYFGWLSAYLKMYPDTENLKTRVHLRDNGCRPFIELQKNGHPLALEQQHGITLERVGEIYACMEHGQCPSVAQ